MESCELSAWSVYCKSLIPLPTDTQGIDVLSNWGGDCELVKKI